MSYNTQDKNQSAEERSENTQRFAWQVRSATPRKCTAEEKIQIVFEGFRREVTANELCCLEGIKPNNFYSWAKEFMETGERRLSRDTTRDTTGREITALKQEKLIYRSRVVAGQTHVTGRLLSFTSTANACLTIFIGLFCVRQPTVGAREGATSAGRSGAKPSARLSTAIPRGYILGISPTSQVGPKRHPGRRRVGRCAADPSSNPVG